MCGTGSIGQQAYANAAPNTTQTQVAGASGGGATDVAGAAGGGDTAGIAGMLTQLATVISSLVQALQGSGLVAGAEGGGPTGGKDGGMAGCDMMGGAVGGEYGGGYPAYEDPYAYVGDGAPDKGSDVGGESGAGAPDKGSEVGGESGSGAPDKGSEVGGESGSGAPDKDPSVGGGPDDPTVPDTPPTAVEQAQAKVDAAKTAMETTAKDFTASKVAYATKHSETVAAGKKVETTAAAVDPAKGAWSKASKALTQANADYNDALQKNGSHKGAKGDSLADIAARYGISVDKLKSLNPDLKVKGGKLTADATLKLPKGIGPHAEKALLARDAARDKVAKAKKAYDDAVAAAEAARKALEAAKKAEAEAKKAALEAERKAEKAKADLAAAEAALKKAQDEAAKAETAS
jgi:hypothetical protein